MSVPFTRTLPYVLRESFQSSGGVRLITAKVVSAPDNAHVVVELAGVNITVPRLASYTGAAAGQSVYLLASELVMIAIGTVKT